MWDREHYITRTLDELAGRYGPMDILPVYESAAFGCDDRTPNGENYSARTLDIDLLTYNDPSGLHANA